MGVRDFRDLIAWQLSDRLRSEVLAFTATGPAARDFKYRDQIRDSGASTPRNIAEGFGRFRPRDFARFCEFALASLNETQDGLIDGRNREYLDQALFSRIWNLSKAAERATKNLMRYLKSNPDVPRDRTLRRKASPNPRTSFHRTKK
jgi:four helix bundle protein